MPFLPFCVKNRGGELLRDTHEAGLQLGSLLGVQFHHQASSAINRNPHDEATTLLGNLHGAIPGTRFHRSH